MLEQPDELGGLVGRGQYLRACHAGAGAAFLRGDGELAELRLDEKQVALAAPVAKMQMQAVSDGRVPLRFALALRDLGPAARRRIFAKPRAEQKEAIDTALHRHHGAKKAATKCQHALTNDNSQRAQRVISWTIAEEAELSLHGIGKKSPLAGADDDPECPTTGEVNE